MRREGDEAMREPGGAPSEDAWSKPVVSIRLSTRRRADLARIASGMAKGSTPSAAIDAAIAAAVASPAALADPLGERLDALEAAFESAARDMLGSAGRRESEAADAARASRAVLELMSAAGSPDEPDEPAALLQATQLQATPLEAWLGVELVRRGSTDARTAIVGAAWRGMRRSAGAGSASVVEFDARLAAVDGKSIAASPTALVRSGPVDIGGSVFSAIAAHAGRPMFIALRRAGLEWTATLFASNGDGAAAEKLGGLRLHQP